MIRHLTSRARRGASPGAALALLLTAASPAAALADDAGADRDDARGRRSGFSFDLRLGVGLARAEITERDRPIVDLNAYALGGAMRFGTFLSPHVLIGAELALSWAADAGEVRVRDADYFSGDPLPRSASYGSFSPLGAFVEVYPWERKGFFFGAAAGVGMMDLPSFADGGGGVMAGYSLELGYELEARANAARRCTCATFAGRGRRRHCRAIIRTASCRGSCSSGCAGASGRRCGTRPFPTNQIGARPAP